MRRRLLLWLSFWLSALWLLRSWGFQRDRSGSHASYCRHDGWPLQQPALLLSRLSWRAPRCHGLARPCISDGMALRATACRPSGSPGFGIAVIAVMSWIEVPLALLRNWPSRHSSSGGFFGGGFFQLCSLGLCLLWVYAGLDSIFCVAILAQIMWGSYLGWMLVSMSASGGQILPWLCLPRLVHLWHCFSRAIRSCHRVPSAMPLLRPRRSRTAWLKVLLFFLCGSEVSCQQNGGGAVRQDKFVLPSNSQTRRGGEPTTGGLAGSWRFLPTRISQSCLPACMTSEEKMNTAAEYQLPCVFDLCWQQENLQLTSQESWRRLSNVKVPGADTANLYLPAPGAKVPAVILRRALVLAQPYAPLQLSFVFRHHFLLLALTDQLLLYLCDTLLHRREQALIALILLGLGAFASLRPMGASWLWRSGRPLSGTLREVAVDAPGRPNAPYNCLGFCTFCSRLPGERQWRICFRPCVRGLWADVEGQHRGDCRCDLHCRNRFAEVEEQALFGGLDWSSSAIMICPSSISFVTEEAQRDGELRRALRLARDESESRAGGGTGGRNGKKYDNEGGE